MARYRLILDEQLPDKITYKNLLIVNLTTTRKDLIKQIQKLIEEYNG